MQACQRQIRFKPAPFHIIINDIVGFLHLSFQGKPSCLFKFVIMLRIQIEFLAARPESIVVDVDLFQRRASHHRHAKPAIAQIMGVTEFFRRLIFPKQIILHSLVSPFPAAQLILFMCGSLSSLYHIRGKMERNISSHPVTIFQAFSSSMNISAPSVSSSGASSISSALSVSALLFQTPFL